MCGLLGMAGRGNRRPHQEALKELFFASTLRGQDGTGLLTVNTRPTPEKRTVVKTLYSPIEFLRDHGGRQDILSRESNDLFMGHCRWPTMGSVTKQNVHPFDVGGLVGAHNGTLESKRFKPGKGKTDSQVFFERMATDGIIPTLESTDYWDAYAVSIYVKDSGKFFLSTNGRRPLSISICEEDNVMFWASEFRMLQWILARNNIKNKTFTLNPYVLYEFNIGDIKADKEVWKTTNIKKPSEKYTSIKTIYSYGDSAEESARVFNDKIPF